MKDLYSALFSFKRHVSLLLIFVFVSITGLHAQEDCATEKVHGQGYTTTITSVIDLGSNSFQVQLTVDHDGCPGPGCKKLNAYSVEALPGTYSDISVEVISGSATTGSINYGPNLGGVPFQGFRIDNVNGMGNGQQATFLITYTLTGGLQNQQTLVKASSDDLIVSFTVSDFEAMLNCGGQNIFPYYAPPENGKVFGLIGAELTSLHDVYLANGSYISDDIFQIVGTGVIIDIFAQDGKLDSLVILLQAPEYGMTGIKTDEGNLQVTGLYPIENLLALNLLPQYINFARPVYSALGNAGIVTSQGDTAMRSYIARNGFNLDGAGIKVGILSDSYNTLIGDPASDDVLRGDLPGLLNPAYPVPVDVLLDFPYGSRTDEGRAMLQIVHDIAPGAELAFRTGFLGPLDFAKGIVELQEAGCNVIVDDITYISEPFFRDGVVSQAVDYVTAQGVSYFTAAGNYGTKSWQGSFSPASPPPGVTGDAHNFAGDGGMDIYQSITLDEGNYTVVLQWNDGTPGLTTNTDLDIYLTNENGNRLFGFNRDNTGGAPVEVLPFTVGEGGAQSNFMIIRASGNTPVDMKYIVFRGNLVINEYDNGGGSTIVGQANAAGAITVGAVLYSNTPEYGVDPPTIASFSSRGGTPVDGIVRSKPDISAPNGVNTTVDLGGFNIDGDPFPNFFGTSAAAPHAAGLAALILEARNNFYNDSFSPAQINTLLQSTAIDMHEPGHDFASGYGFIQADAALLTMANPSPLITGLTYDTTLVPGQDSIPVFVNGHYLTEDSEIWFNGQPLASGTEYISDTQVTGIIPVFDERYPAITVYNPPLPQTNGTDGGFSNPIYFTTKKTIVISIDDKTKKYGEILPQFTADYFVEGTDGITSLEEEGFSAEEINRITGIPFYTVSSALSNVGLWAITASPEDPLNPASIVAATDSLDIALLEEYNFDIENGLLLIEKMDLYIQPRDTTVTYGDSIANFEYLFVYNQDTLNPENNIAIDPADDEAISSALKQNFATALVNVIGMSPAKALVNELGEPILDATALVNKSFMISEATALVNATDLSNGDLIDPEALYNATALVNAESFTTTLAPAKALVNAIAMAPAKALVNGDVIVNSYDEGGNLLNATALVNASALVNATALVNSSTINSNSNSEAIVILGEDDILILSGDSIGAINLRPISLILGNTAGEHLIAPGTYLSQNFNITYGLGTLTVLPATATVTADDQVIYAGDSLPIFTAIFEGFVKGETDTVVTGLSFTVSPDYTGDAGTYQIIPAATAENYIFTPVNGTLYVNPFGPGTKHIKTKLRCVEQLDEPDEDGFLYVANFEYYNDNSTHVFIPVGEDNYFTSQGSYNNVNQPELFLAGGGSFTVPFDGSSLVWTVKSYRHNGNKTSVASQASSGSSRCLKLAPAEALAGTDTNSDITNIYPNPVAGRLTIELKEDADMSGGITVHDIYGKAIPVNLWHASASRAELDLTGLSAGIYFVRINLGDTVTVHKIIKL